MAGTTLPLFRSIAVVATCILAGVASAAFAQTDVATVAIDAMVVGAAPAGFDFSRTGQGSEGQWVVVDDATADGHRAIEQSSTDATDYRFPLAIYRSPQAGNVEVAVRFKAVAGRVDRAGGIAVRLSDPDNYYVVRANALEDNVRFYRVVKGVREQLGGADIKVASDQWHTLALKVDGDRFMISLNGQDLYTVTDKTFANPGKVALWTKADSVTRFDRVRITLRP